MIKQYIPQTEWIGLDEGLKNRLVLALNINKSIGQKQVVNGKLVQDGVTDNDLKKSTDIGTMLMFLGEEDSKKFLKVPLTKLVDLLWEDVKDKLDDKKVATKENDKPRGKKPIQRTNGRGYNKVR